jgi:hypothetical protein
MPSKNQGWAPTNVFVHNADNNDQQPVKFILEGEIPFECGFKI